MPASATVKTPAKKAPVRRKRATAKKPVAPRTRKAAANPTPTPKVEKVELKSILKDYPRDGFALILLPILLLEAAAKEILPVLGKVKVPASFG
jgi:hypothetical protein